jgi:tetratricopeptide (TPR) repeat protein
LDEATEIYRDLLKDDAQVAGVWLEIARGLERAGRAADAVHAFDLAAQASPGEPAALLGAANVLLHSGKFDAAREHAQRAVKSAPASAHETLTRVALARNNASEAAREAERAEQADPTLPMRVFVQAVTSYKSGKYEQAAPLFEQALGGADGRAEPIEQLHYYYADTLARLARYPDAELHFKEEIRLFPQSIPPRVSLALLYRAERRLDDARAVAEDLARVAPSPDGYAAAARVWTILGDKDRATLARAELKQRFGREGIGDRGPARR